MVQIQFTEYYLFIMLISILSRLFLFKIINKIIIKIFKNVKENFNVFQGSLWIPNGNLY